MPSILLSLISSGLVKWSSIILIIFGLSFGLYFQHRQIVSIEREKALIEYNAKQLEQSIKDKDAYLKQMEDISRHKSEIINDLYNQKDILEQKAKDIEIIIEREKTLGNDRESSKILKDTFKELENMK